MIQAFYAGNFRKVRSTAEQPFILRPLQVALVKTLERIVLPIKDATPPLAARVEGRSSYARCGLLVHFTAPTIHAGFDGPIVLELCNLSNKGIAIPPGASICQLILEEVSGTPFRNDSQFQKQTTPGGRNGKAKSNKKPNPKGPRRAT